MEWVKVSERLPDWGCQVMVTVEWKIGNCEVYRFVDTCEYYPVHGFSYYDDTYEELMTVEGVVAWMPLPEPYDGD